MTKKKKKVGSNDSFTCRISGKLTASTARNKAALQVKIPARCPHPNLLCGSRQRAERRAGLGVGDSREHTSLWGYRATGMNHTVIGRGNWIHFKQQTQCMLLVFTRVGSVCAFLACASRDQPLFFCGDLRRAGRGCLCFVRLLLHREHSLVLMSLHWSGNASGDTAPAASWWMILPCNHLFKLPRHFPHLLQTSLIHFPPKHPNSNLICWQERVAA